MSSRTKILELIASDAEKDASSLDGQPFDGKTVATNLGQVYASIQALAQILEDHISNHKSCRQELGCTHNKKGTCSA